MPLRILVVDDNQEVADFLAASFEQWGYRTATAYCGVTGLAMARAMRPDVVLLNVCMPRMSGLAVLKELRGDPATAGLKVILTSALGNVRELAEEAGAQDAIFCLDLVKVVRGRVEKVLAGA